MDRKKPIKDKEFEEVKEFVEEHDLLNIIELNPEDDTTELMEEDFRE